MEGGLGDMVERSRVVGGMRVVVLRFLRVVRVGRRSGWSIEWREIVWLGGLRLEAWRVVEDEEGRVEGGLSYGDKI